MSYSSTDPAMNQANINSSQGLNLPFGPAAGAGVSQALVSAFDVQMYLPDNLPTLFERNGRNVSMAMRLETMGYSKGTKTPTTGHYEISWAVDNLHVGTIISGGGTGADIVISVDDNSTFTINGTTVAGCYVNEQDNIFFVPGVFGWVVSKNTSVSPIQITLRPNNSTIDLADYITEGERYAIPTNSTTEGTGFAQPRVDQPFKYTNAFQIVQATLAGTGTSYTNATVFQPLNGKEGPWMLKVEDNTYYRQEYYKDGALVAGSTQNNLNQTAPDLGYATPVGNTEGLIDFASIYGHNTYIQPGLVTVQDIDDVVNIQSDERVAGDVSVWQGQRTFMSYENTLKDYSGDDCTPMFSGEKGDFTFHVGFKAIEKGGKTFMFHHLDQFSDVKGLGGPGYPFQNWSIFTPITFTTNKLTGASNQATMGWEWKEDIGYSRKNLIVTLDGTGQIQPATYQYDIRKMKLFTELAFHATCPNQMVCQQPVPLA